MVAWNHVQKFTAVALGTSAGLATYYYKRLREQDDLVYGSWSNGTQKMSLCAAWDSNWDFRDPRSLVRPMKHEIESEQNRYNLELEKMKPKASRHIILVRHGEYLDIGDSDESHHLTQRGKEQARYTGKRLQQMGIKWDKVIASTMTRAQETAGIMLEEIDYNKLSVLNCDFIREGAPIPPQPPIGHWKPEAAFFRDGARIEAAFRRYFYRACPKQEKDSYTLIIGHGNVIRYFVCRALQFPPEAWLRININHASITWLTVNHLGNVSIRYLGDTGFMPVEHLTNRIPRDAKNIV